jgi:hypothetical protein
MQGYSPSARTTFILAAICIAVLSDAAMASGQVVTSKPLPAPPGHAQPTPGGFLSGQVENPAEQQRLSRFDAQQHQLDEKLDESLNICRC